MCMYTEHLYGYPYARALGRCPVAKQTPAHATRSRAHMPAFTHNRTNGNPYPYLSALKKVSAPLVVVSTAARLHCGNGSHYLSGCVSWCLRL
jgi:hypothetical protein